MIKVTTAPVVERIVTVEMPETVANVLYTVLHNGVGGNPSPGHPRELIAQLYKALRDAGMKDLTGDGISVRGSIMLEGELG